MVSAGGKVPPASMWYILEYIEGDGTMNTLYYGDNLPIMRQMAKDSVEVIYLDPPFNYKSNYNILYRNMTGRPVPEQEEAFCDTWQLDPEKEQRARDMPRVMLEYGVDDY